MKNCVVWHELCGKEGKLEINFIPARTYSKNKLYLVAISILYVTYITCNEYSVNCSSVVKIFLCRCNIFTECVTIV